MGQIGRRADDKLIADAEEAGCEILGLSKCSAYAAANSGELPAIRIGRRWIVPRHALERMLSN